jgi:glycosyltransferase involved in cell wall biosynthesis
MREADPPTLGGLAYLGEMQGMAPAGRCSWVGNVMDVRSLYQAADVAVVPSRAGEAFARAVIEPMSAGIPTLASINGGNSEALRPAFSDFLFEVGDSAALAEKRARLRDWREREPQLGRTCREHLLKSFSGRQTLDWVERLFTEAVRSKIGGP